MVYPKNTKNMIYPKNKKIRFILKTQKHDLSYKNTKT